MLKERVTELKAIRDQARADVERAAGALDRLGPSITPQALKTFASQARRRMRTESGGYRRDHLRALAQRIEVDAKEVRIMGAKSYCCARSSPLQAQKRLVLECPVLYRNGAPFRYKAGCAKPAVLGLKRRRLTRHRIRRSRPDLPILQRLQQACGHSIVRHICADALLSRPNPSNRVSTLSLTGD